MSKDKNIVHIYTDGACRGNPGDGGWGVLIEYENVSKEYFGGELNTTNNKMELKAAIEGLKALKEPKSKKPSKELSNSIAWILRGKTSLNLVSAKSSLIFASLIM